MKCRIKSLVYTVFSLGSVSSLVLMVYTVTHSRISQSFQNAFILLKETTPDDFIQLMNFNDLGGGKEQVNLLVVTNSAPHKFDRRMAIRSTWWRHCAESQVKCFFVTDGIIEDRAKRINLLQERNQFQDMAFQPLRGGMEFGLRFLNQIKWVNASFDFKYLLKVDDDYFVCLKRLLNELPLRPTSNLVWGYFHCQAGITWVDEAFVIFSNDVIHKFVVQDDNTTLCHPFADQQIGLWMKNLTKRYFHDRRLHHHPPASFLPKFQNMSNVCDSYLGIHGTYVEEMRAFGKNDNDGPKDAMPTPDFSTFCKSTKFDHRVFEPKYRFDPRPCKENPFWNNSTVMPAKYSRENFRPKKQIPARKGNGNPAAGPNRTDNRAGRESKEVEKNETFRFSSKKGEKSLEKQEML